jgi:hypothetical protein
MLPILLIVTFMYVLVGLVLLRYQEKWYEENQPSFIKNLSPFDYVRYVFKLVFWWLPNIIINIKFKKKDIEKPRKSWWERHICEKVPDDLDI